LNFQTAKTAKLTIPLILMDLKFSQTGKNVVFRNAFSVKIRLFGTDSGHTFVSTKEINSMFDVT
jgi:hypothetical protein